ncbi:blast:Conserved oligomeric Golgi complex subunit 6 [Drosophila guanche]|uniref:Blast:Conserved oligomeric Golgi complex subunit 6 n=1 Tax=Drosophila guanche TaxID=7266 RepID=A0A3B0JK10_DROGU|nr:blast:Conserved oligomeric Golgi complex subunit 6 [Drosophila guanche]
MSVTQDKNEDQDRIQRRVNKILETRLESDKDTLDALNGLSSFFKENTLQNRRNLRSQIEHRSVGINENFLKAFREVKLSLDAVCADLDTMATSEILSVATMVDGRQADITKIVSCVIDPLLQSVQESAAHLPTVDMGVYLLNCLYHMQSTLAVYEYMDERVERLQAQSDAQLDTLTSEQASSLVANLNLGPIYTILQSNQSKIETNLLKIFMSKLDAFLELPDVLLLPQVQLIMSSSHRATVQKRAFNVIVAIYKQIYERVHDPANGFEQPDQLLHKTPEQVAHILTAS